METPHMRRFIPFHYISSSQRFTVFAFTGCVISSGRGAHGERFTMCGYSAVHLLKCCVSMKQPPVFSHTVYLNTAISVLFWGRFHDPSPLSPYVCPRNSSLFFSFLSFFNRCNGIKKANLKEEKVLCCMDVCVSVYERQEEWKWWERVQRLPLSDMKNHMHFQPFPPTNATKLCV